MEQFLINLSTHYSIWVYIFIIFLACAEGPIISLVSGLLIKLGYFNFTPIYLSLMVGDLLGDTFWYYLGHFYGHKFITRFGKYFDVTESSVIKVKEIFHKHKHPILFVSKITNGFGFALATLITAGIVKIPFKRYLLANATGQFVLTGFLISIGYFFSNLYLAVDQFIGRMFVVALFIAVIYFIIRYSKYLQKKIKNIDYIQ